MDNLTFVAFGVGEAVYFGTMTGGPGAAAAVPTITAGAKMYVVGSFATTAGSAMQAAAGAPTGKQDIISTAIMSGMGAAAGAGPVGAMLSIVATDVVTLSRPDPCR